MGGDGLLTLGVRILAASLQAGNHTCLLSSDLGREGPDWGTRWYDCEGERTGTGTWQNLGLSPWGGNGDTKTPDRFACGA